MYYWFLSMLANRFLCLFGVTVHFSNANLVSLKVHDTYNVIFLKFTFYSNDAYRQQAHCLVSFNTFTAGSFKCNSPFAKPSLWATPFLYTRHAIRCRNKTRTHRFFGVLQQVHQYIVLLPVGYDDGNTLIRHFAGNGRLGQHASPAETRFLRPDIVGQVFPLLHLSDDRAPGAEGEPS